MRPHLVCLVVVLRVILKHLGPFLVVEGADEVIGAKFLSPLLVLDEPGLRQHLASIRFTAIRTSVWNAPR